MKMRRIHVTRTPRGSASSPMKSLWNFPYAAFLLRLSPPIPNCAKTSKIRIFRMSISTRQHTIITSHGSLAVEESGQGSIPVLLIHGNSSCRGVSRHQLQGRLAQNHRLIAFDLPGHGQSSNAPDPTQSYTHPGFADAAIELLGKLGVTEAIVFGWSLGGHIGIEMVPPLLGDARPDGCRRPTRRSQ
jgi:pimeloyl-ACP methyl ester carboxylesterase